VTGKQFDADCYGCINAKGCYYCPGDGTCENSPEWQSSNKIPECTKTDDYLSANMGDTTDSCIADDAYTKDPLYGGSQWVFEMIDLLYVWDTYDLTGKGITIRINDDGVFVDNKEFSDRFDDVENSCGAYLPQNSDADGHGTAVAGIILGNANNDLCSVGIAHKAKFSSCNFFVDDVPYSALAYKIETFDISQNSVGMP
jgi:subtilisin family serine protease